MNKIVSRKITSTQIFSVVLFFIAFLALFAGALALKAAAADFDCTGAVPTTKLGDCQALVDLYNNAGGSGWTHSDNWLSGSPCDSGSPWYGVTCSGSDVTTIDLTANGLSGILPAKVINLSNLQLLRLGDNQISGPLPQLTNKQSKLFGIYLNNNKFAGPIPEGFGSASDLQFLYLNGNVLRGLVPLDLCDLSANSAGSGNVNIRYNALEIDRSVSNICLDAIDSEWRSYQTVPPDPRLADLHVESAASVLTVSWEPIPYTAGGGFYEVFVGQASKDYDFSQRTQTKSDSSVTFQSVPNGTTFYIAVRTQTNADLENNTNGNIVVSSFSEEVTSAPTALAFSDFQAAGSGPSLPAAIAAVLLLAALSTAVLLRQIRKQPMH
jgi:hypothetical protein